jgi:hypothetical protein
MSTPAPGKPSFSPYRKWRIGLNVGLISMVVLSVVVMVNYLSRDYFTRIYLNERTKIQLHPRTLKLLESLTNEVKVTVFYDKKEELYSTVVELLNAYSRANRKVLVLTVDYQRDPAGAKRVKEQYRLSSAIEKNLVIFDCAGKVKQVNGNALADYTLEPMRDEGDPKYRRKPVAFKGEKVFTSVLLEVTSPKPLKAYFLQGHGEHLIDSAEENGYMKMAAVLRQNYVEVAPLSLLGSNAVPSDCNLLVVGGAKVSLLTNELERIEKYLSEGGRLLALFNTRALNKETGLEQVLARWGVGISPVIVNDPDHSDSISNLVVSAFSKHALINPIVGSGLYLERPRPVFKLRAPSSSTAEAPRVEAIAFSGPRAYMESDPKQTHYQFPLMVAVEQGAMRAVVAGDSILLDNGHIDLLANRDFAVSATDWLLDRMQLLEGLSGYPVTEYKLVMTTSQFRKTQWILLGGMPGGVLLFGGLVWLRRRR